MIGKTVSHYRILEKLGEGGMGVVYKAEDTKLKRTVALKFLPPELTRDSDSKKRFIKEAQAASSLQHHHITAIHEIDETDAGQMFIAMDYYEGETLKDKINRGPMKWEEAIDIAMQIANGLKEAHEKDIVHRDIKPANIMLTTKGQIKIMDFGLAKLAGRTKLTKTGATLGTAAYMSPEQTRGQEVDHRSDIWSLGVVLYEMITGQRPFKGDYEQAVVYAIVNEEPEPLTGLRTGIPLELERIVTKLLHKDPDNRYQHIDEIPVDLKTIDLDSRKSVQMDKTVTAEEDFRPSPVPRKKIPWKTVVPMSLGAVVLTIIVIVLIKTYLWPVEKPVLRFSHTLPLNQSLGNFAISPDGKQIIYVATTDGVRKLYLRSLNNFDATPLEGTEGASKPFFSPTGLNVGFFADEKLKKVSLEKLTIETLCDAERPYKVGGAWGDDDTIVFNSERFGLAKVSSSGGNPEVLIPPDTTKRGGIRFPEMLPGSKAVLYTEYHGDYFSEDVHIVILSFETGISRRLINNGTHPHYSPTGHITFARSGSCWAVPFDLRGLQVNGNEFRIYEDVYLGPYGYSWFHFSKNGNLVYRSAYDPLAERSLYLVNHYGKETPLTEIKGPYQNLRFSHDGNWIAFDYVLGGRNETWIHDVERDTQSPFATEGTNNRTPSWTPDDKKLVFSTNKAGRNNLFIKSVDGGGEAVPLYPSENFQYGGSWSDDGSLLVYSEILTNTNWDIWVYSKKDSAAYPFLETKKYNEYNPRISPDGKWIVYTSNKTGKLEVYIKAYPGPGREIPISVNGGRNPEWGPGGKELFYVLDKKMMAVTVGTYPSLNLGIPRSLFETQDTFCDVHPDGERFLMMKDDEGPRIQKINVVVNWFEELKEKIPSSKQ